MPLRTRLPVHAATLLVLALAAHAASGDPARPPPVPAPSPAAPVIVPPRPLAPLTAAKETVQEQCLSTTTPCSATQIGPVSIPSIGLEGGF
jgi:hypothetical protein